VNGSTEPGATLTINGNAVNIDAGGNFSVPIALQEGANTLTIVATDSAGNSRRIIRVVTRDSTAPSLTVTSPVNNAHTTDAEITVTGTTDPGVAVTVNGEEVLTGTGGEFSRARLALKFGENTITVIAIDRAGNIARQSVTVFRDEVVPPPPPPPPPDGNKSNLDLMIPYILVLLIVIGGIGAGAWIFKSSGTPPTPPPGARRRPPQQQGQQGPARMRTPTEEAIARKEGYRPSDRPKSADELYGRDYGSKKPGGYQQPKYDYTQPPSKPAQPSTEPDYTDKWTQQQATWDAGSEQGEVHMPGSAPSTPPPVPQEAAVWQPAQETKVWQPPAAPAEEQIPQAPVEAVVPAPAAPAKLAAPAKPAALAKPAAPAKPTQPSAPAEPTTPAEPEPTRPDASHAKLDSDIESLLAKIGDTAKKK
jgi:hypothetical protein